MHGPNSAEGDPVAITATGVTKQFAGATGLHGVDLTVPAGTVTALLGPNGAGKTTMVRILATLLRPDAGTIRIGGYDVLREPGQVQAIIGLTGQSVAVDAKLSGPENLRMFGRLHDTAGEPLWPGFRRAATTDWLAPLEDGMRTLGRPELATVVLAVIRGLLQDLDATGDTTRTDRAFQDFLRAIERR